MFVWTPDMIRFMQAANEKSDYHARLAAILAPRLPKKFYDFFK